MKTKTIKIIFPAMLLFLALSLSLKSASAGEARVIATINIYNSKIVSQDGNKLKIGFEIFNRENVQPDVRYGILLQDEKGAIVDEQVYSEALVLNAGQTIKKEIEYDAPGYLNGKYKLWIESKNSEGLPFANIPVGEVSLQSTGQFLKIDDNSCNFKISGESEDKKYSLIQGVDVARDENLVVFCQVRNDLSQDIVFQSFVKTYYRSQFGDVVSEGKGDQESLKKGESKNIEIKIPKPDKPQAYDLEISLLDPSGKAVSTKLIAHYVLRGGSASIQNIRLDKNFYIQEETANLSFTWSGSADVFPGSRLGGEENSQIGNANLEAIIKTGSGENCSSAFSTQLKGEDLNKNNSFNIPIISNCSDPQVSLILKDENGNILDQKSYNLTPESNIAFPSSARKNNLEKEISLKNIVFWVVGILTVILIITIITIFKKKRMRGISNILLFLIIPMGFLFSVNSVLADTIQAGDCNSYGNCVTYTVQNDKSNYLPGEQVTISGSASFSGCWNQTFYGNLYSSIGQPADLVTERRCIDLFKPTGDNGSITKACNDIAVDYSVIVAGENVSFNVGTYERDNRTVPRLFSLKVAAPNTSGNYFSVIEARSYTYSWDKKFWEKVTLTVPGSTQTCVTIYGADYCYYPTETFVKMYDSFLPNSIVVNPFTSCICGSSNGGSFPVAPTTNLCTVGETASAVTGIGPWYWTCSGASCATATCSANLVTCGTYSCVKIAPTCESSDCGQTKTGTALCMDSCGNVDPSKCASCSADTTTCPACADNDKYKEVTP